MNNVEFLYIDDLDYSILEDPLPKGVRSILVVRETGEKDFGAYNCTVSNPYGSQVKQIFLVRQSK